MRLGYGGVYCRSPSPPPKSNHAGERLIRSKLRQLEAEAGARKQYKRVVIMGYIDF